MAAARYAQTWHGFWPPTPQRVRFALVDANLRAPALPNYFWRQQPLWADGCRKLEKRPNPEICQARGAGVRLWLLSCGGSTNEFSRLLD